MLITQYTAVMLPEDEAKRDKLIEKLKPFHQKFGDPDLGLFCLANEDCVGFYEGMLGFWESDDGITLIDADELLATDDADLVFEE